MSEPKVKYVVDENSPIAGPLPPSTEEEYSMSWVIKAVLDNGENIQLYENEGTMNDANKRAKALFDDGIACKEENGTITYFPARRIEEVRIIPA